MRYKKLSVGFVLVVTLIFSVYLVSAGIGDWFNTITGRATSGDTNVTVTLSGSNPVTVEVFNNTLIGATVTPVEDNPLDIEFIVRLSDVDSLSDINESSVSANFSRAGEALRQNSSCQYLAGQDDASGPPFSKNFSCTITTWFFDAPGTWTITAGGNDEGNGAYVYNETQTFIMATTTAMVMSPASISFGSVTPGTANETTADFTLINNTGNANITNITVTAVDLVGQENGALLGVNNFTVGNNTGGNAECDYGATNDASIMLNASQVQVGNAQLLRGNYTIDDGTGQEQLYYCFMNVPNIETDAYSPPSLWTVSVV
jgi:hypothetical protein